MPSARMKRKHSEDAPLPEESNPVAKKPRVITSNLSPEADRTDALKLAGLAKQQRPTRSDHDKPSNEEGKIGASSSEVQASA